MSGRKKETATVQGVEVEFDPDLGFVSNETDIDTADAWQALNAQHPIVASMVRWSVGTRIPHRVGNLFDRNRYVVPNQKVEQMRTAFIAVEDDDIVSGVADSTEALAINAISFWSEDADEEDVWNQWAADVNLDARLKEMWREDFTYSQFYIGVYWGTKTYTVRGTTGAGTKRKKQYTVKVPLSLTMLDPLKIAPLGISIFNREKLVWCASRAEIDDIDNVLDGKVVDPILSTLILDRYDPTEEEKRWLNAEGYVWDALYLLNPTSCFRHTSTRPAYHRLSSVRMKSVFPLLDLKSQLEQMDRAHLVGGTNFIVLIKKGTDQQPAKPEEIQNLEAQVRTVARVPVIVGDHRLSVEIITPKLDLTLDPKRAGGINARITARLYGMFVLGDTRAGAGTATDASDDLAKQIAKGMEARRKMIRRTLEENVFKPIFETNDNLANKAKLKFHPASIALGFDSAWATFLLELRANNEISRETILSQFDLDQADEALMLEREAEQYDHIFQTQVAFSTPNPKNDPNAPPDPNAPAPNVQPSNTGTPPADTTTNSGKRGAGRRGGGTRNGGGAAPGTGQGEAPRRPGRTSK